VALSVAAAVFLMAAPAFGPIPSNAKWRSSDPFGAWNNGGYIVYNNEWNKTAGPQTIWADSFHYWGAESAQAAGNTAVETYPCVQKNFNSVPVRSFRLIRSGFTGSMPANMSGLDAHRGHDLGR
jgi:hypothetical protein